MRWHCFADAKADPASQPDCTRGTPGLAIAVALQLDPAIGGWVSGLAAALVAERLIRSHRHQQEAVQNTVLAGALAIGVLLLAILQQRVELEALLFGDLLIAGGRDLLQTLIAAFLSIFILLGCLYWTSDFAASFLVGFHYPGSLELELRPKITAKKYITTWALMDAALVILEWYPAAFICAAPF